MRSVMARVACPFYLWACQYNKRRVTYANSWGGLSTALSSDSVERTINAFGYPLDRW